MRRAFVFACALCLSLFGLLGAWGSPEWFDLFPLSSAYRLIDALRTWSACALLSLSFSLFFPNTRFLCLPCFLPAVMFAVFTLCGASLSSLDALSRAAALLAWGLPASVLLWRRPLTVRAWLVAASFAIPALLELCTLWSLPALFAGGLELLLWLGCAPFVREERLSSPPDPPHVAFPELSTRESEVSRLIIAGMTNQEIAETLFISLSTVKTHIAAVFRKIGARNRLDAARILGSSDYREPGSGKDLRKGG